MTTQPEIQQAYIPCIPICWPALSADEVAGNLEVLHVWVNWLKRRYALDHRLIPPCWQEHGALVEEISALHTAWGAAFAVTAGPEMPLRWHAEFAAGRQRLAEWVSRSGCRPGEHRPDR